MHFAVASCMRNEAMFLLEWIAHQRAVGFRTVIVATNDCTDGTDLICDQIASVDADFIHIKNTVQPGESAQVNGMARVLKLPQMDAVDYLLHCDSDEFISISCGSRTLDDLASAAGYSDCIALAWRYFGDNDITRWAGGLVTEQFVRCAARLRPGAIMHKSMFKPQQFRASNDHMPKDPLSKDVTVANSRGEEMPNGELFRKNKARFRGTPDALFTWDNACIHHYAVRSQDVFLMKNLRGDGMGHENQRYFLNSKFWRRSNNNHMLNAPTPAYLHEVKHRISRLRAIPKVAEIEASALEAFVDLRDTFLTPEQITKFTLDV